jgi:hypothetical protein
MGEHCLLLIDVKVSLVAIVNRLLNKNSLPATVVYCVMMFAVQPQVMAEEHWPDRITLSGLIEAEVSFNDDESDAVTATIEVGLDAKVNDWVNIHILSLFEAGEATTLDVDEGFITLGNSERSPLSLVIGRIYLPFGVFDSHFLSDPLTLELGETQEMAVQVLFEENELSASLFLYNGDAKEAGENERLDQYGAKLGYFTGGQIEYAANLAYVSNLAESGGLQGAINAVDLEDIVAGFVLSGSLSSADFMIIGEYVAATSSFDAADLSFDGRDAKPTAWGIEGAYNFLLSGKDATVAIGLQGSSEAVNIGLPESRVLVALSVDMLEATSVAVEWVHDKAYGKPDGGSGDSNNAITFRLSAGF